MSFQLGDKVSFLNEALDGIVSKIIDNKMVEVTTKDGFGIPVLITELVKIGGNSEFLPKEEISSQNKKENTLQLQIKSNLENKPYLCFVRNSLNDKELYILNNTGYSQFFVLRIQKAGEWVLIYSGKVSKRSYVFVGAYLDKELDGFRKVIVDTISVDFSLKMHFAPKSIEVKIKTAKFFKDSSYTEIPILEKDAILIDVSGETIKEVEMHQEIKKPVEFLTKKKVLKSPKVVGKIDLDALKKKPKSEPDQKLEEKSSDATKVVEDNPAEKETDVETIKIERKKISGPTVLGKIDLPVEKPKTPAGSSRPENLNKRKRKRIKKVEVPPAGNKGGGNTKETTSAPWASDCKARSSRPTGF